MGVRFVLSLAALLVAGCVSVEPLSSSEPTGAATLTPIASTGPASTRRPCAPGDTRPRCQTPAPATTAMPTESLTLPPTEPPTDPPTLPPTDPPTSGTGVDTDMAISTTAIDFGQVNVGSTAQASVTLTNTGGDPFGPINIFGGAPPTAEFNASQNCQAQTLPAGGSCVINFSFSPGSAGTFNDVSSFTMSETISQSDGENFSVSLTGIGL